MGMRSISTIKSPLLSYGLLGWWFVTAVALVVLCYGDVNGGWRLGILSTELPCLVICSVILSFVNNWLFGISLVVGLVCFIVESVFMGREKKSKKSYSIILFVIDMILFVGWCVVTVCTIKSPPLLSYGLLGGLQLQWCWLGWVVLEECHGGLKVGVIITELVCLIVCNSILSFVNNWLFYVSRRTHAANGIVVPRPPALCQGCGHRDMYTALTEVIREEYPAGKVFSDIGCYTLGWLAPLHAIDTCVDMGASITMAKGAADAGQHPSVAVIGDSTFTHSGMTGLLDAVNERADITVIISDNLTTGMTGGQDSAGTGRLEQICAGIGVDPAHIRTVVPLPKNREEMKAVIREEIAHRGVSVIIPRRECIQTAKRHNAAKK